MRITTELGKLIRELREAREITRNELADRAGISVSHLEKIEAGLRGSGMNTLIKIMLVLDVHINLHSTGTTTQENVLLKCRISSWLEQKMRQGIIQDGGMHGGKLCPDTLAGFYWPAKSCRLGLAFLAGR